MVNTISLTISLLDVYYCVTSQSVKAIRSALPKRRLCRLLQCTTRWSFAVLVRCYFRKRLWGWTRPLWCVGSRPLTTYKGSERTRRFLEQYILSLMVLRDYVDNFRYFCVVLSRKQHYIMFLESNVYLSYFKYAIAGQMHLKDSCILHGISLIDK